MSSYKNYSIYYLKNSVFAKFRLGNKISDSSYLEIFNFINFKVICNVLFNGNNVYLLSIVKLIAYQCY